MPITDRSSRGPDPDPADEDLVVAAQAGDLAAYRSLLQRWCEPCFDLAWNVALDQDRAVTITRNAFLMGWPVLAELEHPGSFGARILRITRNQALNQLEWDEDDARNPVSGRPGGRGIDFAPAPAPEAAGVPYFRRLLIATLGARQLSLLDLRLRYGVGVHEIADELQIGLHQADEFLAALRSQVRSTIGAAHLWHGGEPSCPLLAAAVPGPFDASGVERIRRHQSRCGVCSGVLRGVGDLEELYATSPPVPGLARSQHLVGQLHFGAELESLRRQIGRDRAVTRPTRPTRRTWSLPARLSGRGARTTLAVALARPLLASGAVVLVILLAVAAISL